MNTYLIGIDIGTSGTKTALFDEAGNVVASKTVEYPLYQPRSGWAEQDPDDWVRAAIEGLSAVASGIDAECVRGIGLSGQMHGLVMLDSEGKLLRRSIIWCDQRTEAQCREITETVGSEKLIKITNSPALTGFTASKILWVRENEPEIYEKCRHILTPKDYVRYRLTGELATDVSDASGVQLFDIGARKWSDEMTSLLGIDAGMLPSVYESCEVTGVLSEDAANKTGLRRGIPVVGGAGDNEAAAVGCGVVSDGKAFATIGTSGVVFAHSERVKFDPKGRIHGFCAAVPGEYHVMGVIQSAGLSLRRLRDNVCAAECEAARRRGVDPYAIMDEEAEKSPVGSNGLIFLPYLMGERSPHLDPCARGGFIGLTAAHTRGDMIRSVLEGVIFAMRDSLSVFGEIGISPSALTLCGGGASSPLWRQIAADIFGCEVDIVKSGEGGALGAAILAGVGTGVYGGVKEACGEIIKPARTYLPSEANRKRYDELYGIYDGLYGALRETNIRLAEFCG
ncbi:MAG: xylulokinase [Firmicutes bacterium]|nr:xylulokinase [Bacillota bacterium]